MFRLFFRKDRSSPPPSPSRPKRVDTKSTPPRLSTNLELRPNSIMTISELQPVSFTNTSELERSSLTTISELQPNEVPTIDPTISIVSNLSLLNVAVSAVQSNRKPLPSSSLRSPLTIIQDREKCGYSFGEIPVRCYSSEEDLMIALNDWSQDVKTDLGGFKILSSRHGKTKVLVTKGPRRLLTCDRSGKVKERSERLRNRTTKRCDCPWAMWIEESTDGWMLAEPTPSSIVSLKELNTPIGSLYHSVHNHPLYQSREEKNTNAALRSLNDKQMDSANMLAKAGLSASSIFLYLQSECVEMNEPVTFTKEDVYNKYFRSTTVLDCTNVATYLHTRYSDNNKHSYDIYISEDGILHRLFFLLGNGYDLFNSISDDCKVVLYDTKHGTNRYGYKVGMIVTIDGNGKTQVLAGSILKQENEESFSWVFASFTRFFGGAPKIVFTDSDPAMAKSIRTTWSTSTHLLCIFHIWKNYFEHIHPLFIGQNEKWSIVSKMFWQLAKNSDISGRYVFDKNFDIMVAYIQSQGTGSSKKEQAIEWLKGLKERKTKWAATYTWENSSLGIHSTVRSEAINSVIASFCQVKNDMSTLVKQLETMVDHQSLKIEFENLRRVMTCHIQPVGGRHPYAEILCQTCTPYAAHIIRAQAAQAMKYSEKNAILDPNDIHLNSFKNSLGEDAMVIGRIITTSMSTESTLTSSDWRYGLDFGLQDCEQVDCHIASYYNCSCQFFKCLQLPCRHMFSCMILQSQRVQLDRCVIGQHWLKPELKISTLSTLPFTTSTHNTESSMNLANLVGRRTALMASGNQMIDFASKSVGMTKACLNHISAFKTRSGERNVAKLVDNAVAIGGTIKDSDITRQVLPQKSTTVISTLNVTTSSLLSREEEEEAEEEEDLIPISALGVGNPPLIKNQKKKRLQPSNRSAPTTKGYKQAGLVGRNEKRREKFAQMAQSAGFIS